MIEEARVDASAAAAQEVALLKVQLDEASSTASEQQLYVASLEEKLSSAQAAAAAAQAEQAAQVNTWLLGRAGLPPLRVKTDPRPAALPSSPTSCAGG